MFGFVKFMVELLVMKSETWDISKLKNWESNPRNITSKDFARLVKQIKKLGTYKPLIVTPEGEVLGGNMRLKALQEIGEQKVWVSIVEPKNEAEKLEYALSDNDRAGEYVEEELAELVSNNPIELELYNVDLGKATPLPDLVDKYGPEAEEDEPPEVDESNVVSKLGEIYQLGKHRVMCGDSTDKAQVEQLMDGVKADMVLTDPPYGMDLDTDYSKRTSKNSFASGKKHQDIIGDKEQFDASFLMDLSKEVVLFGADYYVDTLPNFGKDGSWMVWDKRSSESQDKGFGSNFETIWSKTSHKRWILRHEWFGFFTGGEKREYEHPTTKPIKLFVDILNKINPGNNVLDLFLGSGSTLIACEQTGRICYGIEIDPKYVDVIRKRYAKFIGKEEEWEQATPLADQPN